MKWFTSKERAFAGAVSKLTYCNPFLAERIAFEREALGPDFKESKAVWNLSPDQVTHQPNVKEILKRVEALLKKLSRSLGEAKGKPSSHEQQRYEDLVIFFLYYRYLDRFLEKSVTYFERGDSGRIGFYEDFKRDALRYLSPDNVRLPSASELPHLFACFFQVRRAFAHIFQHIIGVSAPAVRLRAMVWQSIFTHDMQRYRRALYRRMGDIATMITGPSGTGKELVARAIGLSRYLPFDPKTSTFPEGTSTCLQLNLAALSPTLIESELFGHRRGAFTGAVADRKGWLEHCPAQGTVFLDEIGDLDPSIQVKLLRVLENRTFQRLGETRDRRFKGKIITATHRDLAQAMEEDRFREDLYYRLCSDILDTPGLAERIQDNPDELKTLVLFLAEREAGDEASNLADEVMAWIGDHLGPDYPWPGNIRELGQCVRNVLIRKAYHPAPRKTSNAAESLAKDVAGGTLTSEELLRGYCTMIYCRTGSFEEAARRLGLDRRTVKAKIDPDWVNRFMGSQEQ